MLEGKRQLPHQELLTLTRFKIRGASLAVGTVGAALAHAQTFCARESGAAIVQTRGTLAVVKLGCVFLEGSPEVVPSGHRTGDVSHQVRDGSELEKRYGHLGCHHHPLPMAGTAPHVKGVTAGHSIDASCTVEKGMFLSVSFSQQLSERFVRFCCP